MIAVAGFMACMSMAFLAGWVVARAPRRFHEPRAMRLLAERSLVWPRGPRPEPVDVECKCGRMPRDVMPVYRLGEREPEYMCLHCRHMMQTGTSLPPIAMPVAGPGARRSG